MIQKSGLETDRILTARETEINTILFRGQNGEKNIQISISNLEKNPLPWKEKKKIELTYNHPNTESYPCPDGQLEQ